MDGGTSYDASQPSTCMVKIIPVLPAQLTDLPAGPTSRLRVRGEISGTMVPAMPTWLWSVQHHTGKVVAASPVDVDPSLVQFSLSQPGNYKITANAGPSCFGQTFARAFRPQELTASFWVRVTPPAGTDAPPQETILQVLAGNPLLRDFAITTGTRVGIDPTRLPDPITNVREVVKSYIRITSPRSSFRIEGSNSMSAFRTTLSPSFPYDVLIVPESAIAPLLVPAAAATTIAVNPFTLADGTLVSGTCSSMGGAPVSGARVLLRAGGQPSTVGQSDGSGKFTLRARAADRSYSAFLVPPPGSGLPEAEVPNALFLGNPPPPIVTLDFQWRDVASVSLGLTVHSADDLPAGRVRVRLESLEGSLDNVGTLTASSQAFPASGSLRAEGTTSDFGVVTFANLPRARYQATLIPGSDIAAPAVTTVFLDLTSGTGATVAETVRLLRKVQVSGVLKPADLAQVTRLVATDTGNEFTATPIVALVDDAGRYSFTADPGRSYRLYVEPVPARSLPRTPLGPLTGPAKDKLLDDYYLPRGLAVTGRVMLGQTPIPGAVLQAYCTGAPPDCVDISAPSTDLARAVAEAVSDGAGAFTLIVPDPGTGFGP